MLLTGHTGFKGCWASLWLESMGAEVAGYSLAPDHDPDLFSRLAPFQRASSTIADLADAPALARLARQFQPTLVLHMAAQPLVRRSYVDPVSTFQTNLMGTVHLLEAVRDIDGLRAVLVVTTDKVYDNPEQERPFREEDPLGGHDPYSASKAAAEIVTASYAKSFFEPRGVPVATARAGNVIGGGDWSEDRLVPDIWRALHSGRAIRLRYPQATRPWQHVLESLSGYFRYLELLADQPEALPRALNFGPTGDAEVVPVSQLVERLQEELGVEKGWVQEEGEFPPEKKVLALDSSAAVERLGWAPRLSTGETLQWTADWYRRFDDGEDARTLTLSQIAAYEARL